MRLQCSMLRLTFATCVALSLSRAAVAQPATPSNDQQPPATPPAKTSQPSAPVPLGVNGQITPWLQVRGEFRARIEGFSGGGFADNQDAYWMDRFRVTATARPSESVAFVVQAQDARAFNKTTGSQNVPLRDTLDLRLAYGEFGSSDVLRVGRQELAFGEQRLLGHVSWLNTARSFDGARYTLKRKALQLDAFAASVVTIRPDAFDKSGNGNALFGLYGSAGTLIPKHVIEPYFFWRQSRGFAAEHGGTADLHQATTGVRVAGKLPSAFDWGTEMAVQTGSVGADDVMAWAGHWTVGRALNNVTAHPRLFAEFNHASGDSSPTDGTRGTFDQLYPTPHDKYGLADQAGWRNVNHARGGVEIKPAPKWQMNGSYHSFWLASATDAFYGASGAAVARSITGAAGRHVGQELDAQMAYAYSPQLQIAAGYAYLLPGEFLKRTTAGHAYQYPFVMLTYVFLGEQPAIGRRVR